MLVLYVCVSVCQCSFLPIVHAKQTDYLVHHVVSDLSKSAPQLLASLHTLVYLSTYTNTGWITQQHNINAAASMLPCS